MKRKHYHGRNPRATESTVKLAGQTWTRSVSGDSTVYLTKRRETPMYKYAGVPSGKPRTVTYRIARDEFEDGWRLDRLGLLGHAWEGATRDVYSSPTAAARAFETLPVRSNPSRRSRKRRRRNAGVRRLHEVPRGYFRARSASASRNLMDAEHHARELRDATGRPVALVYTAGRGGNPWAVYMKGGPAPRRRNRRRRNASANSGRGLASDGKRYNVSFMRPQASTHNTGPWVAGYVSGVEGSGIAAKTSRGAYDSAVAGIRRRYARDFNEANKALYEWLQKRPNLRSYDPNWGVIEGVNEDMRRNPRHNRRRRNGPYGPDYVVDGTSGNWGVYLGGDRYAGRRIVGGLKTRKDAKAVKGALIDARYDHSMGIHHTYEVDPRYGYFAVDYKDGGKTAVTGLTRRAANNVKSALGDANAGRHSGRRRNRRRRR